MKQILCLVLAFLLLCGCAAPPAGSAAAKQHAVSALSEPSPATPSAPAPSSSPVSSPQPAQGETNQVSVDPAWSAEETIEAYFSAQYEGYLTMRAADISGLLDMERRENKNLLVWLQMLNQRRRLLKEHGLCYVETEAFSYEIVYDEAAEDDRMSFWQRRMGEEYDAVYHLRIRGELGRAYPPIFALNSQHSVFLKIIDGAWRIVRHYYPGAVRNFYFNNGLSLQSDEEVLAGLREEFAPAEAIEPLAAPAGARAYDPQRAVEYALRYTEQPNELYYNVGDWNGNCQNFVSQIVSCGFGDEQNPDPMTSDWFAGSGGGSPAWENVDYFWNFAVTNGGMGGQVLSTVTQMRQGDVLQLRSIGANDPEDFSHVLFMVDPEKGLFAQNSPANFVYCSDLVNIAARFFRPAYLYA